MSKKQMNKKVVQSPTLKTVLMVENTLKNSGKSVITIPELKRNLPKQVNHTGLKVILEYLEHSNKIAVSLKGITWVHNKNRKMLAELSKGFDYSEYFLK